MSRRVQAVVVTHNRRDLLRECLRAVEAQTVPPERIVVVDNASTDGTPELLATEFPVADVLRLAHNEGATGGFHEAMKRAARGRPDWLWVLDDDTIARPDTLERLLAGAARAPAGPAPALLASRVEWRDGRAHPMNMPILRRRDMDGMVAACERGLLPLRTATWVSLLVSGGAVERYGLPRKPLFYQADDIDYTARILRRERGFCVPDSVVEHRTPQPHDALSDGDARRFYYHARNTVHMLRGDAWERYEKPALGWVVLESSVRFMAANRFRAASLKTVVRAVRDGLRLLPTR
jgi:rhamnopyranosyl-N-acetylglucosaminyl-diphospho-decaprenol beta-1,3/1,4-galactofuranosyltransferase